MKKILKLGFLLIYVLSFSQTKSNYHIGILIDKETNETVPLLKRLKEEIIGVVGEDANIIFSEDTILSNNFNLELAQQQYNQLSKSNVDIILSIGLINSIVVGKQNTFNKPTVVFGEMVKETMHYDTSKAKSGVPNLTYLFSSSSFSYDLKTLRELTAFNNVGIIIDHVFSDIIDIDSLIAPICNELGTSYKIIPFFENTDITSELNDIDAVYMAGTFFLTDDTIKSLANIFKQKGIPSLTNTGKKDVENGIMVSTKSDDDYEQFIRRIALTIESYINGEKLEDLPIFMTFSPKTIINFNTTNEVKIPLKLSLIEQSEFTGSFTNVSHDEKFNLISFLDKIVSDNLSLASEQKTIDLADQSVSLAKSNYIPNITANASTVYTDPDLAENSMGLYTEFNTSGNIALNQTIFSEQANANINIQKKQLKAVEESFNATQLDAIYNAAYSYFYTLILKANANIQLKNLDLTKKNLQLAEQNFKAGQSGKSDLLRFKSEMAQDTQLLVEAYNALKEGYYRLNQLVNNPVNLEIDIEDAELSEGVFEKYNYKEIQDILDNPALREFFIDFLVQESKVNAPELKAINYNLEAIDRSIKLSGAGRLLPTLGLRGQYNTVFDRSGAGADNPLITPQNNYNVGLNISLPLVNNNLNNINKQTAIIQKDQQTINKENFELNLDTNIRMTVLNLINQISNIELSKISEDTAREALDLTQTSYNNGAVNIVQLLDAQNNYLRTRLASNNAVYNYLIINLKLERYLGYFFLLNSEEDNQAFRQRFLDYIESQK